MKTVVTSFLIVLFLGLTSTAMAYSIRDDATGGDCTQIGIWDGATKTCTLTRDLYNIYDMGISADSDGITICGDGHTISGIGIYPSYGVYLVGRSGVTVNNLKIENFTWGIVSGRSVRNTIDNNVVSNCDYGITSSQSTGDIIINNTVSAPDSGIKLLAASYSSVTGNVVVSSCGIDIVAPRSTSNTLTGNTIHGYVGIYLQLSTSYNKIYNNNFMSTAIPILMYWGGSGNVFNLDAPVGGNYYSNFDTPEEGCSDLNNDGSCDSPYYIKPVPGAGEGGVDYLPWTNQDGWLIVPATVDVKPDTLNKESKSSKNAVTAYIEIPEHDLNQIAVGTIKLSTANGSVSAQLSPAEISDYDSDGMPDLMVKFDRQEVIGIVDTGDAVEIKVSGTIAQRTFKESDTIRVIE